MKPSPESNALDPYTYKGTSVLINKQGIRDPEGAKQNEADQVAARRRSGLAEVKRAGNLDFAHLKAIHHHLFQDVYAWAGEERVGDLSKGRSTFARGADLEVQGKLIFDVLAAKNHLRGLDKSEFVKELTGAYADINALHPFREGNGRSTRAFIDAIALRAGYSLDMRNIDKQAWNQAAERSMHNDLAPMQDILMAAIRPTRSLAFEHMERNSALAKFPELAGAYAMQDALAKKAAADYPGNRKAAAHFAAAGTANIIQVLNTGKVPNAQVLQRAPDVVRAPERQAGPVMGRGR